MSGVLTPGVARRSVDTAALVLGSGIRGESATNGGDVRSCVIFNSWFEDNGCSCGRDEGRGMEAEPPITDNNHMIVSRMPVSFVVRQSHSTCAPPHTRQHGTTGFMKYSTRRYLGPPPCVVAAVPVGVPPKPSTTYLRGHAVTPPRGV